MKSAHLTPELLDAVVRLELPPEVLVRVVWDHLPEICPGCAEAMEDWGHLVRCCAASRGVSEVAAARLAGGAAAGGEAARRAASDGPARVARGELAALLEAPPAERIGLVDGGDSRFASAELAELLVDYSFALRFDRPDAMLELAALARRVAARARHAALEVRATAHEANALRITGDLEEARRVFAEARRLLRRYHLVDALVLAELDRLESSQRREAGELEEAERLLHRARLIYRMRGEGRSAALVLQKLGVLYHRQGRLDEAREALEEVLELLDPVADASSMACARQNLAALQVEAGRPLAARAVLSAERHGFGDLPGRSNRLRTEWLEGRIARELGELEAAIGCFHRVVQGFGEMGIDGEAAMVRLDLAEAYLLQGRADDAVELARWVAPMLVAREMGKESQAVLGLLRRAMAD